MPRRHHILGVPGSLTALEVTKLVKPGAHKPGRQTDRDGLHLHVRKDGSAAWVLRYRLHGRQRDLGLGPASEITIAEARRLAAAARALVQKGLDPSLERKRRGQERAAAASPTRTFQAVAEAYIASHASKWRNEKHRKQWAATLERHAYPVIGDWPVSEIDTDAVMRVLKPIWAKTPETASRLRGRIEAVLDHAAAQGWRKEPNPARWRGHMDKLLPKPRRIAAPEHRPSLPWQQVPAFLAALDERRGMAALALRFTILTAARTGEVRGMIWGEVDLERAVWTVPGQRMKAGRLHRVPLSAAAVAVLERVRPLASAADGTMRREALVFPGGRSCKPLSDMALSMLVRGMAEDGLAPGEQPRWRDADGGRW
jgi:integrase